MRFKNRKVFASHLFNEVTTHDMTFRQRVEAAILVELYCRKLPEDTPITIT